MLFIICNQVYRSIIGYIIQKTGANKAAHKTPNPPATPIPQQTSKQIKVPICLV